MSIGEETIARNRNRESLVASHPVITFVLITFSWSWLFWLSAIPLANDDMVLLIAIVHVGGYGPAIGAVLTLGLRSGVSIKPSRKQLIILAIAFCAILTVLIARYHLGSDPSQDGLPANPELTVSVVLLSLLASLIGAWIISNARARNPEVRETMHSLLPNRVSLLWLSFAVFFLPALAVVSWIVGNFLGLPTVKPPLWRHSTLEGVHLFAIGFALTMLVRGGMEEPGWRGFMLPELQKKYSPLVSSLMIAVVWDLWHIPLHLNGYFPGGIEGMIGRSVYIVPLSILFTWCYNATGGNLLTLVLLHSMVNNFRRWVPGSPLPAAILAIAFVIFVVLRCRMYRQYPKVTDS